MFCRTNRLSLSLLRDNRSNFNKPLLTGAYYADPDAMTIESCVAFCDNQQVSYRFMAITAGFQCCTSSVGNYGVVVLHLSPQHATISSRTFSRAYLRMSVKHRAAAIRPRRAVVGASTRRARIQGTARTSSSRLWSPLSVSGRPSDATSELDVQKSLLLYTTKLGFLAIRPAVVLLRP